MAALYTLAALVGMMRTMDDGDFGDSASSGGRQAMFVECARADGVIIAKLVSPSVGQREAPIISQSILAEIDRPGDPPYAVVLDFKRVTFLNSMGLGMCVEVRNRMHKLGGRTILYRLSDQIAAVLKMTRMDRLYVIVNDQDKLENALRR